MSLLLYKQSATNNFTEIATLSQASGTHDVSVAQALSGNVTGALNATGYSEIRYSWDMPSYNVTGR